MKDTPFVYCISIHQVFAISRFQRASLASRSRTSVFRFVVEVLRGFEGRFR